MIFQLDDGYTHVSLFTRKFLCYVLICFLSFPLQVIKTLLEISRKHSWAEIVHCRLICMLTNMFYRVPHISAEAVLDHPEFLIEQVDLLGGIDFICLEVCNQLDITYKFFAFLHINTTECFQIFESGL